MRVPNREQLNQAILASMQSALKERGQNMPLSSRSVWAILAGVLASALSLVYHYGAWVYRQIFPQTQDEAALLLEGERFGLFPKDATPTTVLAKVSAAAGTIIPVGWQASANGELFSVKREVTVDERGSASIELTSLATGVLSAVDKLSWSRPLAGSSNDLEVISWRSGSEAESISDFRHRVVSIRRNRPQGGSISDYILWSHSVYGITKVLVYTKQAGFVAVFPLTAQFGEERIPSEEKRLELEAYLNQEDLAPLGVADVMVGIFTEIAIDVEVLSLSPNTPELRNTIVSAWQTYLWERFPRQFSAQEESTHIISKAELLALAVSAGARQIDMNLRTNDQLVSVQELAYNQIAKLGAVQWS